MTEFKVGFIGLGTMGGPMARNILNADHPLWLYDVEMAKVEELAREGATACNNLQEVAENVSHIIIMVPRSDDVKNVINGLLPHLKPNTTVIDMSTISPQVSREMAKKVMDKECFMLDAPVVKSKNAAIEGTLGIYVGGDKKLMEHVKPLLECMGKEVIYYGANGNGLIMKLCHNMLVGEIQNGVNEMLTMAEEAGLDFDNVVKGINVGGGQNFYLDAKANSIRDDDFSVKFSFQNMHKDMNLAVDLAKELELDLSGAELVKEIYDEGLENYSEEDFSVTVKIVKKRAKK